MPKIDDCELEVLSAYEKGKLKSVATKSELAKSKAAARATAIKDRRVNTRLSSGDLSDIQVKALEEGVPCQTLALQCPVSAPSSHALSAVPQPGRHAVDSEVDRPLHCFVVVTLPIAANQFHLQMIERVDIRTPIREASRE